MKRLLPLSFAAVLLTSGMLLTSSNAAADTYIHGAVGEAEFSTGGSPDMYEIGLGFGLNSLLSLEVSYVNLGTVDVGTGPGEWISEEADGFNFSLVVDIPINDMLGLYASAGNLHWDDTARYYLDGYYEDSYTVEGNDWNFGAGVKAEIFDGLNLKFGYIEYQLDDIEVETVTAGIVYRF